jgi:hypothetical protein
MSKKMPQMARDGKNGFGEPRPKVVCVGCKQLLPQNLFSYIIKLGASVKRLSNKTIIHFDL